MKKLLLIPVLAAIGMAPAFAADKVPESMVKAGCMACHSVDKKLVGPAYKDVAAKYKGKAGAEAQLIEKVRKGGSGVWGPVPMSPNPPDKISDADLKAAVEFVLKS